MDASGGHFQPALAIMRSSGKAEDADHLEYCYDDTDDDAEQFNLRHEAYEAAEQQGWYRGIRHERIGIHIDTSEGSGRWDSLPKAMRARLEDGAFHHGLPVTIDGAVALEAPEEPEIECSRRARVRV